MVLNYSWTLRVKFGMENRTWPSEVEKYPVMYLIDTQKGNNQLSPTWHTTRLHWCVCWTLILCWFFPHSNTVSPLFYFNQDVSLFHYRLNFLICSDHWSCCMHKSYHHHQAFCVFPFLECLLLANTLRSWSIYLYSILYVVYCICRKTRYSYWYWDLMLFDGPAASCCTRYHHLKEVLQSWLAACR